VAGELIVGLVGVLISPDSAGAVDGLNLYVYVGNNPLKYIDPTGYFPLISWSRFVSSISAYKANQRDCCTWVLFLPAMMAVPP
jgi:hypothetical protein